MYADLLAEMNQQIIHMAWHVVHGDTRCIVVPTGLDGDGNNGSSRTAAERFSHMVILDPAVVVVVVVVVVVISMKMRLSIFLL